MFAVLRAIMIVLSIVATMWRNSRYVERTEPEDPEPYVQKSQESMRELERAVQESQAVRERSEATLERVEALAPAEAQRN